MGGVFYFKQIKVFNKNSIFKKSMNEILIIIFFSFITILFLIFFEYAGRKKYISLEFSRKLLHIVSGILIAYIPFIVDNFLLVVAVGSLFTVSNYFLIRKRILRGIDNRTKRNYGIVYYPVAFLIVVLLFWNMNKFIISISFLVFSLSDAFAGLFGSLSKNKIYTNITAEPKTFNGLIVFILSSFLILIVLYFTLWDKFNFLSYPFGVFLFFALIISLVGGITEVLSTFGSDNLFLPIFVSALSAIFFIKGIELDTFIVAFLLGLIVSLLSYKFKFLDLGGSLLTFLLALFIYGLGSWKWTVPIVTFFLFSSVLSKIADRLNSKNLKELVEKGSQRDYKQVLANGGIPLLICFLNFLIQDVNFDWYLIYVLAVAISTSDTWSTEIGTLFGRKFFLITSLQKVERGISGGISLIGTIGGIVGAFVIILSSMFFIHLKLSQILILIFFSVLGNLFDSFLGATLQVKFKCGSCNQVNEKKFHCGIKTVRVKGINFIDNDFVNLSSVFFISLLYFIFLIV